MTLEISATVKENHYETIRNPSPAHAQPDRICS
jgi:hypothetical protein